MTIEEFSEKFGINYVDIGKMLGLSKQVINERKSLGWEISYSSDGRQIKWTNKRGKTVYEDIVE